MTTESPAEQAIRDLAKYFVPAAYQAALRALELHGEMTSPDLATLIQSDRTTAFKALKKLKELKLIYITSWKPPATSGRHQPVYTLGNGPNARKPVRKSTAEVSKKSRANHAQRRLALMQKPTLASLIMGVNDGRY